MSESEQSQLTTQTSSQASSSIEVQQTYWTKGLAGNNFNTVKTRASDADATVYHTLLVNANSTYHWLASRSSYVSSTSRAHWGLRYAGGGYVRYHSLFYSSGSAASTSRAVRPVVSLPSDIIDMGAGYNEETGWNLKSDEEIAKHTVMVGDYINYTPEGESSYTTDKTYTGYSSNETLNRQNGSVWQVLNIDEENNKIEAINSTAITNNLHLNGFLGYNNGVYILNDLCNRMYSNISKGILARSLNMDDIENIMNWDYHEYINGNVRYGESKTYKGYTQYPYQWRIEEGEKNKINEIQNNGILGKSEQTDITTETKITGSTSIEVQETSWYKNSLYATDFISAKTRSNSNNREFYYDLLIKNKSTRIWLASRYSRTGNGGAAWGLSYFGGGSICDNYIGQNMLCVSSGEEFARVFQCQPVIVIPFNTIDINSEYNNTTGWTIK